MSLRAAPIFALVAMQIAAALVMGWISEDGEPTIDLAIYVGLIFSQTSLLGIWGGFAACHWLLRLCGVALGIAFIGPAFHWGLRFSYESLLDIDIEILLLVAGCTLATAGVMLGVRYARGLRIVHVPSLTADATGGRREGLQFSIRHLIVLTFVVACLVTVGKWMQPHVQGADDWAYLATLGVCFVAVGLAAPWAMLGSRHPLLRSAIVLGISLAAGVVPMVLANYWPLYFWIIVMVSKASLLLPSLLFVRWCGYRLVRASRDAVVAKELSAAKTQA